MLCRYSVVTNNVKLNEKAGLKVGFQAQRENHSGLETGGNCLGNLSVSRFLHAVI